MWSMPLRPTASAHQLAVPAQEVLLQEAVAATGVREEVNPPVPLSCLSVRRPDDLSGPGLQPAFWQSVVAYQPAKKPAKLMAPGASSNRFLSSVW